MVACERAAIVQIKIAEKRNAEEEWRFGKGTSAFGFQLLAFSS
jgi:hypothetical protein